MERLKASDFPQEVLKLFDGYVHGMLDRREFLDGATKYAVGGFTAAAMLEALRPNYAMAQQVAKNDPRIKAEYVSYASPQGSGTVKGYLVRPAKASGKLPAIVVIHENRGLNPHIEDITRRLALENYLADVHIGQVSDEGIGYFAGDFSQKHSILPSCPSACNHVKIMVVKVLHHHRDIRRVVLKVAVDGGYQLATCMIDARSHRGCLPVILVQDNQMRIGWGIGLNFVHGVVGRAVVNKNNLMFNSPKRLCKSSKQGFNVFGLIHDRYNHRKLHDIRIHCMSFTSTIPFLL